MAIRCSTICSRQNRYSFEVYTCHKKEDKTRGKAVVRNIRFMHIASLHINCHDVELTES